MPVACLPAQRADLAASLQADTVAGQNSYIIASYIRATSASDGHIQVTLHVHPSGHPNGRPENSGWREALAQPSFHTWYVQSGGGSTE